MLTPKTLPAVLRRAALALALALAALGTLFAPQLARAGALTDALETSLINHLFRGTAYTAPSTWYVGLLTGACSDSAAGTEVSGGSYARVGVASGTGTWAATAGGNGTTSNVSAVNFATPSAGWGTVTHFGLYDASTAGNLLVCSALTASKTINSGDTVSFAAGALTFQIDN
ncbi:MAG: hypothetical protein HS128_19270 [Ideonella sp.]|nr:hypothetical protein [Ideonella sp.]MCC7455968.1 hypothetical protein [Nitrospira sp.]